MSLMATDELTAKPRGACRIELPRSTASTMRTGWRMCDRRDLGPPRDSNERRP
jgi:hypothetical protein